MTKSWPEQLNTIIGAQVKKYRTRQNLTGVQLADRCTALGLPMSRSKVANLENGRARQEGVGIAELIVLATALRVAPAELLFPLDTNDPVPVLPGVATDPWTSYQCFVGDFVLTRAAGSPGASLADRETLKRYPMYVGRLPGNDSPIGVYRQHDDALTGWTTTQDGVPEYLVSLAATRRDMHLRGWPLPPIQPDVAEAVGRQLLVWGLRQDDTGQLTDVRGEEIRQSISPELFRRTDDVIEPSDGDQ